MRRHTLRDGLDSTKARLICRMGSRYENSRISRHKARATTQRAAHGLNSTLR